MLYRCDHVLGFNANNLTSGCGCPLVAMVGGVKKHWANWDDDTLLLNMKKEAIMVINNLIAFLISC